MWRRRRTVLNEALHELRRPLQALALTGSEGSPTAPTGIEHSVRLAATALERLDREINGGAETRTFEPLAIDALLGECVGRWQRRAALAGSSLVLRNAERNGSLEMALVEGDRWALAQALDNLVVNAIEHGGPRILASVTADGDRLRVTVRDCGRPLPLPGTPLGGSRWRQRIRGRGGLRHGHGLRVVRRVAAAHRGHFSLHRTAGGAEAILELTAV
jgi:signal transduction histidine kinase